MIMFDRFFPRSFFCFAALAVLLAAGGCTPKADDPGLVLAEIGDRQVTAEYFKERLARLKQENFPRDEDGQPLDMSSQEGKRAFLDVIIDKELMVAKALQAGYLEDPRIAGVRRGMQESFGLRHFWNDHGRDPDKPVTQTEIDHHYSRLGEIRRCAYLITTTQEKAQQAWQALLDGTPWLEVAARYHHATIPEDQGLEMEIHWGQSRDDLQQPIFAAEEGGITEPFETQYGWWVIQVKSIETKSKPDLDAVRSQIISKVKTQEDQFLREQVIKRVKDDRNFRMNEEALMIIMEGLPEDEAILDPETKKPIPREQLKPLELSSSDYDKILMSYELDSGPVEVTLVDYKTQFERQNVFDRPKKNQGLIALQNRIETDVVQMLVADEMHRLGYQDDPRVEKDTFSRLEELLVDLVNEELVRYDEEVSMQEIVAYYQDHEDTFWQAEHRVGTLLRLPGESSARQAHKAWLDDALGDDVESMSIGPLIANPDRPINATIYRLELGEISDPFKMIEGWGIVRLDSIIAPQKQDVETVREFVARQIRDRRQEQELRRLLDRWSEEFGVVVYEDRLARMPAWEEAVVEADDPPRA
jgi:hypothetical protein